MSLNNSDNNGMVKADLKFPEAYCGDFRKISNGGGCLRRNSNDLATKEEIEETTNGTACVLPSEVKEYKTLMEKINKLIESKDPFFSLEFFPPRSPQALANFLARLDRLAEGGPLFCDMTWHMGSDPGSTKETSSSSVAGACLDYCGVDTMLHITCAQYTKEQTMQHLKRTKQLGLRNILALRGDLPQETEKTDLSMYKYKAVDLVKWTREEYGDYFTIAVAGYPSGHPDAESYEADLLNVKAKVDAGANLIITQLFFEEEEFEKFVRDCRELGITVPIIPGIMPIQSYANIQRIAQLSRLELPKFVLDALEPIKNNDEAVRNYGVSLAVQICKRLLSNGTAPSVHIYTLNREVAAREILQQIGLWQKQSLRSLPWKPHVDHPKRCHEDVRPIFWSSRPKSYIYRTKDWDDFPNGRWGNSSSPAYADLKAHYLFNPKERVPKDNLLQMWGQELKTEKDVWNVFGNFISGKENSQGHKITRLPWNEGETFSQETVLIEEQLAWFNFNGVLTINSQPNVNGAPSNDPLVGWGRPGGYCYQKAYLEFFTSKENAEILLKLLPDFPRVNYHFLNHDGSIEWTNTDGSTPIAVTWGVFPGSEIVQPTVVDPLSFKVWKDEAYDTFLSGWASIYPEEDVRSRKTIQDIHDNYCLVTLVDNDFPLPSCLWEILEHMFKQKETPLTKS